MADTSRTPQYAVTLAFIVDPEKFTEEDRATENDDAKFSRNVIVDFLESEGTVYDYADTMRLVGVQRIEPGQSLPGDEM